MNVSAQMQRCNSCTMKEAMRRKLKLAQFRFRKLAQTTAKQRQTSQRAAMIRI